MHVRNARSVLRALDLAHEVSNGSGVGNKSTTTTFNTKEVVIDGKSTPSWMRRGRGGGGGGGGGSGGGGGGGGGYSWGWGGGSGWWKWGCGGGRGEGRGERHHRDHVYRGTGRFSEDHYKLGEFAQCMSKGRCRGMRLDCPLHCGGPCHYDCQDMARLIVSAAVND